MAVDFGDIYIYTAGAAAPPEVYVPRSWHFRPVGGKIGGSDL